MAGRQVLVHRLSIDWRPHAMVPNLNGPRAVLALRNSSGEGAIAEGMVFHLNRQALDGGVLQRLTGDRPAFQDTAPFQAQVVVQPPRGMLLHNKGKLLAASPCRCAGFRRAGEVALGSVSLQRPRHVSQCGAG